MFLSHGKDFKALLGTLTRPLRALFICPELNKGE
jgi:hypothetical protein